MTVWTESPLRGLPLSQQTLPGLLELGAERHGDRILLRFDSLERSFVAHGFPVRFDLVPGVGHEEFAPALVARVEEFLAEALQGRKHAPLTAGGISREHNTESF